MDGRGLYADSLRLAAETVGGVGRLAAVIHLPAEQLNAWISGNGIPPLEAFLAALDVIADGPFATEPKRTRVAVVRELTGDRRERDAPH